MTFIINDRRAHALGGQSNDRSRSQITTIAWHYTAVARKNRAFITSHENFWKNNYGWDRGGYHFYIDADGNIWQNYNYERMTWGVANSNDFTVHISVEANAASDYSEKQIAAREWLTRKIMKDLSIPASNVKGHWEVYNNSSCPGYSRSQMDAFRAKLAKPAGTVAGTTVVAKPTPAPSKPSGIVTSYQETGSFKTDDAILVRDRPSTSGTHIATYQKGEVLEVYHTVHIGNGYVWLEYTRGNGGKGFLPIRTYNGSTYGPFWGWIGEVGQFKAVAPVAKKPYIYLPATESSWRVYPTWQTTVVGNEVGFLNPKQFGGLEYAVLKDHGGDVVEIQTSSYGRVKIWAGYPAKRYNK